jgi:hypothetical protein
MSKIVRVLHMKIISIATVGIVVTAFSACATIAIPNASVSRSPSGEILMMTGTIQGSLVSDSPVTMTATNSDLTCSGATNTDGVGEMTCSDGSVIDITVPPELYGSFSGSYVTTQDDGTVYAAGWGQDADLELLAAMLDQAE